MRRAMWALFGAALLVTAGCASLGNTEYAPAPYPNYVDESIFYAQLDPYGTWVDVEPFGFCWAPDDVPWGWRPYSYGSWAMTDFGWTWISDEPWGWATYHYGRWIDDPQYGWIWVPGNEWAGAWVAWRYSDNWVGWAALPPDVGWNDGGLSGYGDNSVPAEQWCFVHTRKMMDPGLQANLASSARNETLIGHTHDVTRFEIRDGRPVNHGIEVVNLQRVAGRQPPELTIVDAHQPVHGHAQVVSGSMVTMFRTTLRPTTVPAPVQHQAPHPGPQPQPQPHPVVNTPALEKERESQQRQAQAAQQRELTALNRDQAEELKQAHSAEEQQAIVARQAAEKKAFEERSQKENQRMQAILQRRFAKVAPDTTKAHHGPPKTLQTNSK